MQTRYLGLPLLLGLAGNVLSACGSNAEPPITTLGNTSTAGESSTAAGATSSAGSGAGGASAAGGSSSAGASGSGNQGTAGSAGALGSAGATGSAGAGSTMSAGCNKPLPALVKTGTWSDMADQSQQAGLPPPIDVPCDGTNTYPPCVNGIEKRGYYVYVNPGYDPSKPSKVIYEGAGCDDSSKADGGTSGYAYSSVDQASAEQVIQVGLDYDRNDECYDNTNPDSNDFKYFPIVQKAIEDNFCVDTTNEMYSGYSSGAWLGNQFSCAFPSTFRAMVFATGNEPTQQPTCAAPTHPIAAMFLHDLNDTINTYAGMLPGCSRMLKINGCSTTTCDPSSTTTTTTYAYPTTIGAPQSMACVSFNGCPADGPVVWCTTQLNKPSDPLTEHYADGNPQWITPLFWSFLNKF
ncbi:MAG TPA: hypothetical protein VK745_00240 [Polyangiaceae bacterium]|jgi:hypothetical protein|nr:hypothetical protein [Polyangiaceae bacterium]